MRYLSPKHPILRELVSSDEEEERLVWQLVSRGEVFDFAYLLVSVEDFEFSIKHRVAQTKLKAEVVPVDQRRFVKCVHFEPFIVRSARVSGTRRVRVETVGRKVKPIQLLLDVLPVLQIKGSVSLVLILHVVGVHGGPHEERFVLGFLEDKDETTWSSGLTLAQPEIM